ncbi:MAG: hypothetical protein JWN41_1601 [Thermoleophilia bacterium]|nr:hypothetical protein [Thermoleophilia bacterium]
MRLFHLHRRHTPYGLLVAVAALALASCGGERQYEGSSKSGDSAKPVATRDVTPPTADAALTKKLGGDGAALATAGCVFGSYKAEDATHVESVDDLDFQTFPPTSGTHYPVWASPGVYDDQVPDGFAVHDLEHGEVVVWLGTKVPKTLAKRVGELPKKGEKWVVSPRSDLAGLFASAWTKGLSCPPAALTKMPDDQLTKGLRAWYTAVVSTGSPAEKDIPAYPGAMKEPTPTRDISVA